MKRFLLALLVLTLLVLVFPVQKIKAQPWFYEMSVKKNGNYNFYDIQKSFNDYWASYNVKEGYYTDKKGIKRKATGWKQFKRWEWYWAPRINQITGEFPEKTAWEIWQKFKPNRNKSTKSTQGTWTSIGAANLDPIDGGAIQESGTGRINCAFFDPSDNNHFWVGAPAGGLWETTDGGSSWNSLTDANPILGVSDITIPNDYNITTNPTIFIATGDRDAGDDPSIGVLKTVDGGSTWTQTGLTFQAKSGTQIGRLIINPDDKNIMWAATSIGIYKSTDAAVNWTLISGGNFIDMELIPGSTAGAGSGTLIATTNGFDPKVYRTTDGGTNWVITYDAVSYTGNQYRCDVAVTPANSSVVYIIMADYDSNMAFEALFRSNDGGINWTEVFNQSSNNLYAWSENNVASDGGQGWYDVALAVSSTNADVVYVGGVNAYVSTNGGIAFSICSAWDSGIGGADVVHADHHNAYFRPSDNRLFDCNDGGFYYSDNVTLGSSSTWTSITNGLVTGQLYDIGISQTVDNEVVAGYQDNGTKLRDPSVSLTNWSIVNAGDGMSCAIDPTTVNTQWGTYANLRIHRTTDEWTSNFIIRGAGSADWAAPLEADPINAGTIYIGTGEVERYVGTTNTVLSSSIGASFLKALDVYNDGSNLVIWTASLTGCWKSNTSGGSYTAIAGLPADAVTDIAIDENDYNHVYVCFGGFDSNNVYETTNGGTSWTDISTSLPAVPCGAIVINEQNTTENEVYVGTDAGIYVKLGNAPWQLYNSTMPYVSITDLEIYYDSGTSANTKIYAATYGRGTWVSDLYTPPTLDAAISEITSPTSEYCSLGSYTPTVSLSNIGTTTLTSATISYSIDGGVPVSQNWTGSLAQGLSATITFPSVTLSYGQKEFVVTVSNPNSGTDQNTSNDSRSIIYSVWNNALPYTQNFDNFVNGGNYSGYAGEDVALAECWINDNEGGIDWSVNSGSTGSVGTGPDTYGDHTSGLGKYLYTETSSAAAQNQRADVLSPTFDLTNYTGANISFWYHMLGTNMGTINIDLYYGGVWYNNITVLFNGVSATSLSGNQADAWRQATADISAADGNNDVVVRFRAEPTASDYTGDMAIDDFTLNATVACTQPNTQASNFTATPDYTTMDISWTRGDGDNVLIVAREGGAVDTDPIFNTSYTANAAFGLGNEIGIGNFVVFNGTGTTATITGLTNGTNYYFAFYEYNNTDICYLTPGFTGNSTTLIPPPLISSIIPDNFYADLGKQLSISGSGFNGVSSVVLGGVTGSIVSNDGTTIVIDFPAGNYADDSLFVTNPSGVDTIICTVNTRNIIPVGNGTDSHTTITSALNGLFAWWGTTVFDANKVIDVYTGTYAETVTPNVNLNPTAANMLVIQAHTDDVPVINATGNANGVYIGALDYVKFEGFTVYGATNDNIYTEGDYNQITFNRCYGSTAGSGIKLNTSLNSVVTNNLLYTNYNYGLHLLASDNLTVKNNTSDGNGTAIAGSVQTLLDEGFEGVFLPVGWNQYDVSGDNSTRTWIKGAFSGPIAGPDGSSNYALITYDTPNIINRALETASVNLTGYASAYLEFYMYKNGTWDEIIYVEISTNAGGLWTTLTSIGGAGTNFNGWSPLQTVNLDAYVGNTINVRFRYYQPSDDNSSAIDVVKIIATSSANNIGAGLYVESGSSISLENNIFTAKTGTGFVALKTDAGSSITTNYNTYYKDAGNTNLVNYLGVNYADFAAWPNEGANDLESNPLFVNAGTDFHLQSTFGSFQGGQWPPISAIAGTWTNDASLSLGIDAGNADAFANEPAVNGSIINLGCYGNTQQASKSGASTGTAGLWTGAISTNWVVSGNWDDGNVPIESSNAVIPVVTNLPVIADNAVCNNLTINASSVLTIDATGFLNVIGTLTNNAGTAGLVLNSSVSGDGTLIYNNSGIDVTVQRYLYAPPSSTQWHYLSSPITAAPVSLFNVDFYTYDESTDDWWTGSTLYGTSGWNIPTGNLVPLSGYIFNNSETTINFTGQLNFSGGDYNVTINYTEHVGNAANGEPYTSFDAWNLVGNPYTSELDWDAITKTNVDATIYYYDDLAHNYAYYIDGVGSVNGGSRYIPAMQGFFVKASSTAGGTLTIPLSARVNAGQDFFKKSSKNLVNNVLKLAVSDKQYTDETLITLQDNASLLFDNEMDAYKRFSWDSEIPQVYALNAEKKLSYAINSLPLSVNQHIIPIGFRFASTGNYTVNVTEFSFADYHVFIEDTYTNDWFNLRDVKEISIAYDENSKTDRYQLNITKNTAPIVNIDISDQETELSANYSFTIAENVFSDIDLGDKLSYAAKLSSGASLPKWLSFNAQNLRFSGVPTELQVLDIEIEAKDLLGEAVSTGFKLSVKSTTGIKLVENTESVACKVYPNPNHGKFIIEINGKYSQIQYEIISISGKLMKKAEIKNEISNQIDVSDLANGTYILNLKLDDELTIKKSIVIEY